MYEKLGTAADYIQTLHSTHPRIGIVLGSGLGAFVESVEEAKIIPYRDIPYFRETTVEGHEGRLILGKISGVDVALLQGRLHAYEGLPMEEVVFPVRVLATLGIESLILTNASGGINLNFRPGNLVIIKDHINLMGKNPLIGPNINELGPRFPDMTYAYNKELKEAIKSAAKEIKVSVMEGVYCGLLGPTYETPAEIHMLRILGADMVGMSTVPEAIAANHLGLKVAGISCITNMAAGIEDHGLNHQDVKEEAKRVMEEFSQLLKTSISKMGPLL